MAPLLLLGACGAPKPKLVAPSAKMLSATIGQLVANFNRNADAVKTMQLKLELTAHSGEKKEPSVTAFLLTQKPASIRIWGTFTLLGRVFDMASDGTVFELFLPTSNQFYEGRNDVIPAVAKDPLKKMRPQVVRNALLINPIAPGEHVALDPAAGAAEYRVLVLAPGSMGVDRLVRSISFSRYDLLPHSQIIYDKDGVHATHASYGDFTLSDGVPVPTEMNIERPVEGYSLRLRVVPGGITLNHPFATADPFELQPPPGSKVIKLSASSAPQPGAVSEASR